MPTFKPRKKRASEYDKKEADIVLGKYLEYIPDHYTVLIQVDLAKRELKGKYSNQQIYDFVNRRNFHADIRISFKNVGKFYYDEVFKEIKRSSRFPKVEEEEKLLKTTANEL